jgi:calcium binding protein 39
MASFLPWRGRARTNTADLPKQAKEQIAKLDGPGGPAKVGCDRGEQIGCHILKGRQVEELAKTLGQMKFVLQGTQGNYDLVVKPYNLPRTMLSFTHQKSRLIHNKSTASLPG